MYVYTLAFLVSAAYSIVIETGTIAVILRALFKYSRIPLRDIIIAGTTATLITIPYVWYVFPILLYRSSTAALITGELFAIMVETLIYWYVFRISLRHAFMLSLSANALSYFSGQLLRPSNIIAGF